MKQLSFSYISLFLGFFFLLLHSFAQPPSITCPADLNIPAATVGSNCTVNVTVPLPSVADPAGTQEALNFDGVDDRVRINSLGGFVSGDAARTFEAWIRRTDTGDDAIIFEYGDPNMNLRHFIVKLNSVGQLVLDINGATKSWNTSLNDGEWHHIAIIHGGGNLTNTNASVDGNVPTALNNPTDLPNTGNISTISIGTKFPTPISYFEGDMDEVRFWSVARGKVDLLTNINSELTGTEPGLELYMNFNEGAPCADNSGISSISDLSGGNDGVPIGFTNFNGMGADPCRSNFIYGAPLNGYGLINSINGQSNASGDYPAGQTTTVNWQYTDLSGTSVNCATNITLAAPTNFSMTCADTVFVPFAEINCEAYAEVPPPVISDPCGSNSALRFNGINDYVGISSLAGFVTGDNARSVEAWVRRTDTGDDATVFEYGSPFGSNGRFVVEINFQGDLVLDINGSEKSWDANLNDATWHHIAVVHNGGNLLNTDAYVDGQAVPVLNPSTTTPSTSNISTVAIGTKAPGSVDYFEGDIDEVRFWNIALTQTNVQNNMNSPLTGNESGLILYLDFNEGAPCADNTGVSEVIDLAGGDNMGDLVGFGNLAGIGPESCVSNYSYGAPVGGYSITNDFTGTSNASGNYPLGTTTPVTWTYTNGLGLTATCVTEVWVSDTSAVEIDCAEPYTFNQYEPGCMANLSIPIPSIEDDCFGNSSLHFDGVDDRVTISYLIGMPIGGADRTFESWIRRTDTGDDAVVFRYGSPTALNGRYVILIDDEGDLVLDINGATVEWDADLNDGNWHHIAVSNNSAQLSQFEAYVDGQSLSMTVSSPQNLSTMNSAGIAIGSRFIVPSNPFEGEIDEVRFWGSYRDQNEIQATMTQSLSGLETDLIIYLPFNEGVPCNDNSGLIVTNDLAGNDHNGTLTNFSNLSGNGPGTESCISNFSLGAPIDGYSFTNDYTGTNDASGDYPIGTTPVTWTYTNSAGETITCTQDIEVANQVIQECDLFDYDPGNFSAHAILLNNFPGPTDRFIWEGGSGSLIVMDNNTALIRGTIVNSLAGNIKFEVRILLQNQADWTTWDGLGRTYNAIPANQTVADANHMDWDYWTLNAGSTLTGSVGSFYEGDVVNLSHLPVSFLTGFQKGLGANAQDGDFGFSGEFSYNGTLGGNPITEIGSLNNDAICSDNPCGEDIDLAISVLLGGFENAATGVMADSLRSQGVIPLTEPYTALGFNHVRLGGGEQIDASVLALTGNNAIVDWVVVELRDGSNPNNVVSTRSALMRRTGNIVDLDGASALTISVPEAGNYYVAIHHRTHLAFVSATAIPLSSSGTTVLNFKSGSAPAFGTNALLTLPGAGQQKAMIPGDTNMDGAINAADRANTWNDRNQIGYLSSDLNGNGVVDAADRATAWNNRNLTIQFP